MKLWPVLPANVQFTTVTESPTEASTVAYSMLLELLAIKVFVMLSAQLVSASIELPQQERFKVTTQPLIVTVDETTSIAPPAPLDWLEARQGAALLRKTVSLKIAVEILEVDAGSTCGVVTLNDAVGDR